MAPMDADEEGMSGRVSSRSSRVPVRAFGDMRAGRDFRGTFSDRALLGGLKWAEIAARLGVPVREVRLNARALYRRHGVTTRRGLCAKHGVEPRLTRRCERVARGLVAGSTVREIASEMGVGYKEVIKRIGELYRRLGVRGFGKRARRELVARLLASGLLEGVGGCSAAPDGAREGLEAAG